MGAEPDQVDFDIQKDFDRVQPLLINSAQQQTLSKKKDLGEQIFSPIPQSILAKYFITLFKHVHDSDKLRNYVAFKGVKLHHLVCQVFCSWTLSLVYSRKNEKKNQSVASVLNELAETDGNDSSNDTESTSSNDLQCPFEMTYDDKQMIVKTLIQYEFPPQIKILNLITKGLGIPPVIIVQLVKEQADVGRASFSSLLTIVSETMFNTLPLWNDILPQCLLLGKVNAMQIESYASPLSDDERKKTRAILLDAESTWQNSIASHAEFYSKYTHREGKPNPPYDVFRNNLLELMLDLRQKSGTVKNVDPAMAIGLIKQSCIKRYHKAELNDEQLMDLIVQILCARPQIKMPILKILEKYGDDGKRMAAVIRTLDVKKKNLPSNQFVDVNLTQDRSNYLSIPVGVKVKIVNKPNQLQILKHELKKYEGSSYPYVGLDAEWSPYLSKSRASILQLSLRDIVYIIDMDACAGSPELEDFFNELFNNKELIKVGFKFTEDLSQLRGCSPSCDGLYRPTNLICIHKLFHDLIKISKKEIGSLVGLLKPSKVPFVDNPEILKLQAELEDPDFIEENPFKTPEVKTALLRDLVHRDSLKKDELDNDIVQNDIRFMGLSAVCIRVLGKSLDKSEQCSAWDRRPLRPSQIRYAALDAYCMLQLMDVFIDWCNQKNLDLQKLIQSQPPTKIPFPLFFNM